MAASLTSNDLARAASELRWYHTIDLPGGVTTPGRYDHRPIVDSLPWPSLRGLRCLDIGSRDGFFAFEMERRGASEVVSLDIADPSDVDFPRFRPPPDEVRAELDRGNRAFEFARAALRSRVRRELRSVYELQSDAMGTFDFAAIGTLLLHLRDPVRALAAIKSVLRGPLLINEPVDPYLQVFRRRPLAEAVMPPGLPMWWGFNRRGLERIVNAAGFDVAKMGRPYILPNGPDAPHRDLRSCFRGRLPEIMHNLIQTRGDVHVWLVARPIP